MFFLRWNDSYIDSYFYVGQVFSYLMYVMFDVYINFVSRCYYFYFIDKDVEVQRGELLCQGELG